MQSYKQYVLSLISEEVELLDESHKKFAEEMSQDEMNDFVDKHVEKTDGLSASETPDKWKSHYPNAPRMEQKHLDAVLGHIAERIDSHPHAVKIAHHHNGWVASRAGKQQRHHTKELAAALMSSPHRNLGSKAHREYAEPQGNAIVHSIRTGESNQSEFKVPTARKADEIGGGYNPRKKPSSAVPTTDDSSYTVGKQPSSEEKPKAKKIIQKKAQKKVTPASPVEPVKAATKPITKKSSSSELSSEEVHPSKTDWDNADKVTHIKKGGKVVGAVVSTGKTHASYKVKGRDFDSMKPDHASHEDAIKHAMSQLSK
jgi:hypothetical protein